MKRLRFATKLPGATIARARVIRADGTVEDKGVLRAELRWWNPKDYWRVLKNIKQFGWRNTK